MEQGVPSGYTSAQADRYFVERPGSDFMVDVIKTLDLAYLAINPGSSFRGLQESIVNHGDNLAPELLTCAHEETAVGLAHGYAKAAYAPMAMACHGTVGLQHAAMAIYNAWCDRVPIIVFAGNHLDAADRRPGVEWSHSVQDAAKLVRDFIKWDDTPVSLPHFGDSVIRAYKIAMTPPMGPVVIVVDGQLQEQDIGATTPRIPTLAPTVPPHGDPGAVRETARLLLDAERPVIIADRAARTPAGMARLVDLAEALQAPVVDRGGRLNFPTDHYLNHTSRATTLIGEADVILGLELYDFWGNVSRVVDRVHREEVRIARPDATLISLGVNDLFVHTLELPKFSALPAGRPVDRRRRRGDAPIADRRGATGQVARAPSQARRPAGTLAPGTRRGTR